MSISEIEAARTALRRDRTIDIVTTGARTGLERTTEIWFTNIGGRIILCGTPSADGGRGPRSARDWLANLKRNPEFLFRFKESLTLTVPSRAVVVTDPADRRQIMSAPETRWYRDQGFSADDLVQGAPIVEVFFLGAFASLTRRA
ncbi:MAG: nitroreductase/quinone reductase family protein [Pseudomonadales bacterium]